MHFLQAINSDLSVLIVCNKTGGTIKGDIKIVALLIHNGQYLVICYKITKHLYHQIFLRPRVLCVCVCVCACVCTNTYLHKLHYSYFASPIVSTDQTGWSSAPCGSQSAKTCSKSLPWHRQSPLKPYIFFLSPSNKSRVNRPTLNWASLLFATSFPVHSSLSPSHSQLHSGPQSLSAVPKS